MGWCHLETQAVDSLPRPGPVEAPILYFLVGFRYFVIVTADRLIPLDITSQGKPAESSLLIFISATLHMLCTRSTVSFLPCLRPC